MKNFILIILSVLVLYFKANPNDSIARKLNNVDDKINNINDKLEQIKQGQLNYQIEKDLLKETYSNNYDRINTVVTIILGIIGVLAFLGIKDITSIKKEYQLELENLRNIKTEFQIKSKNFESDKDKFEKDIKDIVKQNEEQNNKIKVLELKEKISKLLNEDQLSSALEYSVIGIEIAPYDVSFYNSKGVICSRLNQYEDSMNSFKKALEIEPDNLAIISNFIEILYLTNNILLANELIKKHENYFKEKDNKKFQYLLKLIENFHTLDASTFKNHIITYLDFDNLDKQEKYFSGWNLKDCMYFAHAQEDSEKKTIFKNILWYLDGSLSTRNVIDVLQIEFPTGAK